MKPINSLYSFCDPILGDLYLCHKSYSAESNERLEFLGDALLGAITASWLYDQDESLSEKQMSLIRASIVNNANLAGVAKSLGLESLIKVGHLESKMKVQSEPRILASTLEAYIAAVYLDSDFLTCQKLVLEILDDVLKSKDLSKAYQLDYKTDLQEKTMKKWGSLPTYTLIDQRVDGPKFYFKVSLSLGEGVGYEGEGSSKKQAEQNAAQKAIESWESL